MKKEFEQQVAIVTGAGQGIGFEICRQLASSGAKVVLNDIDEDLTRTAVEKIKKEGLECFGFAGDAANPLFIQNMINNAIEKFGKLTIAIANAGITLFGDFLLYQPDDFYKVVNTNLGGSFFLAQFATRQMKLQQSGGSILFMSSVTGHQAHKDLAVYSMTKAALEMLAKNLVAEVSSYDINVNAIAPGATITERTLNDPEYENTWSSITPMGRPAYPSDIANAALFLVSSKAKHITGQTIIIDGGWTCMSPSPYDD